MSLSYNQKINASEFPWSFQYDWELVYHTTDESVWATNGEPFTSAEWSNIQRSNLAIEWCLSTASADNLAYTFYYYPWTFHWSYVCSARQGGGASLNGFNGHFFMPLPGQPFKQFWVWINISSGQVKDRRVYSARNFSNGTYTQGSQGAARAYPLNIYKILSIPA